MSMSTLTTRFVITLPRRDGESIASFAWRHCEANLVPRVRDLLALLEADAGEPVRDLPSIARSEAALRAFERLTGLASGELESLRLRELQSAVGPHLRQGDHVWPADARCAPVHAVCPACLQEDGYGCELWEFVQAPVCTRHGVALRDECPSCSRPLRVGRSHLLRCGQCGESLAQKTGTKASASAAVAAALVQRPRMLAFGRMDSTSPIDVQDLSGLLRLCLLPRCGEPADFGLTEKLPSIPIARRIEALDVLGAATRGRHVDSVQLRVQLLRRWPYAGVLPREQQSRLLARACGLVGLPRDVRRLVCQDADVPERLEAVEVFGGRLPRLETREQLMQFLDVDSMLLDGLAAIDGTYLNPDAGYGFDMDEVLDLRRLRDEVQPVQEVDQMLGLNGLAEELVRLNLLQALHSRDGVVGIHPSSTAGLLERVHQRVCTPADGVKAVALQDGMQLGLDVPGIAWAVAQVVGGSLAALGWQHPGRLATLEVDARRLAALAHWPRREHASELALVSE